MARSEVGKMRKNAAKRVFRTARDWLGLRELTEYAAVSERTLREWIHSDDDPLPASRIGNKLLVNRHAFDDWMGKHAVKPANCTKQTGPAVSVTAVQH